MNTNNTSANEQVSTDSSKVTICIPHYNVTNLMELCLGAIRHYTSDIDYEVIVVDNGSEETALKWLRSIPWIRLVERGYETPENWVYAMNTALDIGLQEARGQYYLIMHSDVVVKHEQWLTTLVNTLTADPSYAAAGSWKLEQRSKPQQFLKDVTDTKRARLWLRRKLFKDENARQLKREFCPRDYCAIYRTDVLRKLGVSFVGQGGYTAGETAYYALKKHGYSAGLVPVPQMMELMDHVAHASGAILPERELNHKKTLLKSRHRLSKLFHRNDIEEIKAAVTDF